MNALQSTFLPLHMQLRESTGTRVLDSALNAVRIGDATVSYAWLSRSVQIDTAEAQNFHVNIPLAGGTVSRSGRLERVISTPDRAAVFMPGLPATIEWRAGCGQFCLMISPHVLQQELEAMLDQPIVKPINFAPAMNLATDGGRAWMESLRLIDRQAGHAQGLLDHPLAAANLERILVDGLLLAQPHNYTDALTGPRRPAPPPAVRQAIELIRSHPEEPWTTTALARRVAVSTRSLQDGFARSLGVPPSQYLRAVRLTQAREELRSADPHTRTVSQVAAQWGFVSVSRFAAAYHQKFGERPSETLRRG
ncbi:AraC family transcriptional regulator [Geodermatophilus sp. CPCC 205506]